MSKRKSHSSEHSSQHGESVSGFKRRLGRAGDMSGLGLFFAGVALGSLTAMLLDPMSGGRRRALLRDKSRKFSNDFSNVAKKQMRNASNHAQGVVAKAQQMRSTEEQVEDRTLEARVKSGIGRVVSHPGSISVSSSDGSIILRGPILTSEVESLITHVRGIRGVRNVTSELEKHDEPGHVPGLQGGKNNSSNFLG